MTDRKIPPYISGEAIDVKTPDATHRHAVELRLDQPATGLGEDAKPYDSGEGRQQPDEDEPDQSGATAAMGRRGLGRRRGRRWGFRQKLCPILK